MARFASLLPEAAAKKDAAALSIAERAAAGLCKMVIPVAETLGLNNARLAFSGSVLQKNEAVRGAFTTVLAKERPGIECIFPERDAAAGALILAERLAAESPIGER